MNSKFAPAMLAAASLTLALGACGGLPSPAKPPRPLQEGIGLQNWTPAQEVAWWFGSQGSRLIPRAWLLALEEPDSSRLFMDAAYVDQFGYIPDPRGGRFPIGFATDVQSDRGLQLTGLRWYAGQDDRQPWIGLNCAACHTNRIAGKDGFDRLVDGAPTMADFQGFTDALLRAMQNTAKDDAKWKRLVARVVAPRQPGEKDDARAENDRAMLDQAFTKLLRHLETLQAFNQTDGVYGHGRLDAVGHILNKVAFLNGAPVQFRSEPDAPVSYPFIWNANQHDFVQWNGLVPNQKIQLGKGNLDGGALVRNTSEVIGVFAEVVTRQYPGFSGYRSSVAIDNLTRMETQLGQLMSPAWPAELGAIDTRLAGQGKKLFERACAECHLPLDRRDLVSPIKAQMIPIWGPGGVATDPGMVCNTFTVQARGGLLTGTKQNIFDGDPLPARAQNAAYLQTQAIGVLLHAKGKIVKIAFRTLLGSQPPIEVRELQGDVRPSLEAQPKTREQRLADCMAAASSPRTSPGSLRTLAYKARPLNGIWATAPYLHNGSVRTLYQLLLPPGQREIDFWVGNHDLDPREVGFVNGKSDRWPYGSWFRTKDRNGPIRGNSNAGHDYKLFEQGQPRDFTDPERMALIEYMKTL
jgi:mono/diheme cytochrome c family protein